MLDEIRIAGIGQEHVAIEPTPDSITMCKKKGLGTFEGVASEAACDRSLQGSADLVVSFEVIEHLTSPKEFVSDLAILAKPGGLILFTGPCE